MQSHGNLILRLYGQAAEFWGEDYLESDRWVQTMGIPNRALEKSHGCRSVIRQTLERRCAA